MKRVVLGAISEDPGWKGYKRLKNKKIKNALDELVDYTMYQNLATGEYVFTFDDAKGEWPPEYSDWDDFSTKSKVEAYNMFNTRTSVDLEDEDENDDQYVYTVKPIEKLPLVRSWMYNDIYIYGDGSVYRTEKLKSRSIQRWLHDILENNIKCKLDDVHYTGINREIYNLDDSNEVSISGRIEGCYYRSDVPLDEFGDEAERIKQSGLDAGFTDIAVRYYDSYDRLPYLGDAYQVDIEFKLDFNVVADKKILQDHA